MLELELWNKIFREGRGVEALAFQSHSQHLHPSLKTVTLLIHLGFRNPHHSAICPMKITHRRCLIVICCCQETGCQQQIRQGHQADDVAWRANELKEEAENSPTPQVQAEAGNQIAGRSMSSERQCLEAKVHEEHICRR
ncbi:uncharacterized protein LOC143664137 isoform X2 [Tamandua tetradactyla]|uniref:uncharacterized protein LOC143664137 isoform X2 n=1 Tax=Tamandua tetradactyla TaxID=48850 RepID=UPI00405383C1